jgi:hypothetical protein
MQTEVRQQGVPMVVQNVCYVLAQRSAHDKKETKATPVGVIMGALAP